MNGTNNEGSFWDKSSYEIGATFDTAVLNIHLTDQTGISWFDVVCYGQTGMQPVSMRITSTQDGWNVVGANNARIISYEGTNKNLIMKLETQIAFRRLTH